MKTQQIKSRAALSIAILMLGVMSLQAQDRRGPHPNRPGQEQMKQGGREHGRPGQPPIPNMTEEQREQMKAIHLDTEKAALPVKNQIGEKEARLKTLITAESYDEKAVNKTIEEIGDLKTEIEKLRVASLQKAKEVLTEEQMLFLYKHMDGKGREGKQAGHGPRRGR